MRQTASFSTRAECEQDLDSFKNSMGTYSPSGRIHLELGSHSRFYCVYAPA